MSQAAKLYPDHAGIRDAVALEMDGLTTTYKSLRLIAHADIEADAERLNSNMRIKFKRDGRTTGRLAGCGNGQSEASYDNTYAGTSDTATLACLTSAFFAEAIRDGPAALAALVHADFDITKAFLHCALPRAATCGKQIVMRLQSNLPHPWAGRWVEVTGCLYGLKQSNALFAADLTATMATAGFHPVTVPGYLESPVDAQVYGKIDPTNVKRKTIVCMVVDDGQILSTAPEYLADLQSTLTARYGPITYNDQTHGTCGIRITREPSGAVTFDLEAYTTKMLATLGAQDLPGALAPSTMDLFDAPTNLTPVDATAYRQATGSLNFLSRVRPDLVKEINHACSANAHPTVDDQRKLVHLLSHLKAYPGKAVTYYTTDGPTLTATVDAAYGVHPDGTSQTGYYLNIGHTNAPFLTYASKQTDCVATGPCEAEYVALTACGKAVLRFRCLLEACGFPQDDPTVIREDALSAINLARAPQISKNSKHIHVRHHLIRFLVRTRAVSILHVRTAHMTADLLTKPHAPVSHAFHSYNLLNSAHRGPSPPLPPP
jgi:hypothetical protein